MTVTVYKFEIFDINSDMFRQSRRWGTLEAIKEISGRVLYDTAIEVDESAIASDIPGLTERNFNPRKREGFPTFPTSIDDDKCFTLI